MESERRLIACAPGYSVSADGRVFNNKTGRELACPIAAHGYRRACLSVASKKIHRTVHSLVLEAFVGPRPQGLEAAHLDGNQTNNNAANLAWLPRKENLSHKIVHGTHQRGERHGMARLSPHQVAEIRPLRGSVSSYALARQYGVNQTTIARIWRGASWRDPTPDEVAPVAEAIRAAAIRVLKDK